MGRAFRRFRVIPIEEGQTLAILLSRRLPDTTRKQASELVKAGGVYVNKLRVRIPSVRVVAGERITVYPQAAQIEELDPAKLEFVHRDPAFVVLQKPPGVPVSQTKQSARGTMASALRAHLEAEGLVRPYVGVVHRLDMAASGLVLFTIRDIANKSLHQQFVSHRIERRYRLRVHGQTEETFRCDAPLHIVQGQRVRVVKAKDPRGTPAITHFTRLDAGDEFTLLEARLETGRTHQIRAHVADAGHPIVGDGRYGKAREAPELHLHAHALDFDHPFTGERLTLRSRLPNWASTTQSTEARD